MFKRGLGVRHEFVLMPERRRFGPEGSMFRINLDPKDQIDPDIDVTLLLLNATNTSLFLTNTADNCHF